MSPVDNLGVTGNERVLLLYLLDDNFKRGFDGVAQEDDDETLGDEFSGKRSSPINLATSVGVFVLGELLHSDDMSSVNIFDLFVLI